MMKSAVACLLAAVVAADSSNLGHINGTCGTKSPSPLEDCGNNDCGSCGNACCKLQFHVSEGTEEAMKTLNASLAGGGPDGFYQLQPTAEGGFGFGDLRPYKKPIDFIGKVTHLTSGPGHYTDMVTITIAPHAAGSVIDMFSVSLIGGAFCDAGQNYKNIVMAMKGASWNQAFRQKSVGSFCPSAVHMI
eukprot:TRINITY_DN75354_c0_g1_i1.p1 TRINITY_DN75354_c0_g1~~TRINITY_DN75354_c0_g1_i1.p1  ORF type:complete len:189 (-),score=42.53 TRINITY_DN75354_c0_g1_i1:259-825(-)